MSKKKLKKEKIDKKKVKKTKKEIFQAPKGMHDILPQDQPWWERVVSVGRGLAELYDFHRLETPILEAAEVFERSIGESSEMVEKQMYILKTKGGGRLAMRPEATASIMRAYLQHHLGYWHHPLKAYYFGPMFRYESPQAGRYRQFHHFGFELIADADPVYDAQIILIINRFLSSLKIPDLKLKLNTIGCRNCRSGYQHRLQNYYRKIKGKICRDCQRRLDSSPMRILDCKKEECQEPKKEAPGTLDHICQNCNNHFWSVLEFLGENGIVYEPDPHLVRGLDYYSRTVFEFFTGSDPRALGGGGRYDYLGELLGARSIPAVGGALGMERVIEIMKANNLFTPRTPAAVFFIAMGDRAKKSGLALMEQLRKNGINVSEALGKDSLKAQLGAADKKKAKLALIFGQKEAFEGSIIVRDMVTGAQETIALSKLVETVKKRPH